MKKWQLVFVPLPGMGHLVSAIEFAKLLINHDHRLSITILVIRSPFDATVDAYISSLASSLPFPTRLQLTLLPINTISESNRLSFSMEAFIENQKPHVREAVAKLNSGPDSPRLAGFVVDMFCTTIIDVADEFDVPAMVFYTSGAAFLGFVFHFQTLRERMNVDTTAFNFKDSGIEFRIPSYVNPVPAMVLPYMVLEKERDSIFCNHTRGLKRAKGIIVNTFEEFEPHAVQFLSSGGDTPVYPVGPMLNLKGFNNPTQQESDVMIMKWLDDQPPSSVLYLCFGSFRYFDQESQVREIARALENQGSAFCGPYESPIQRVRWNHQAITLILI